MQKQAILLLAFVAYAYCGSLCTEYANYAFAATQPIISAGVAPNAQACCATCTGYTGAGAPCGAWSLSGVFCFLYAPSAAGFAEATASPVISSHDECSLGGCDDPHIHGFQNQRFMVDGSDNGIYNLISAQNLQFNMLFQHYPTAFLGESSTWFTKAGVKISNNQISISALGEYLLNGKPLALFDRIELGDNSTVTVVDENGVEVATPSFRLLFKINRIGHAEVCSEGCPHIDFTASLLSDNHMWIVGEGKNLNGTRSETKVGDVHKVKIGKTHGILGQTVRNIVYPNKSANTKYIEGEERDYLIKSNNLFGDDFVFNQFMN